MKKILFGLMMLSSPVMAQEFCISFDELRKSLLENFKETPYFHGISNEGGNLLTLFYNKDNKTFSVVLSRPDGCSSIVSSGQGGDFNVIILDDLGDF